MFWGTLVSEEILWGAWKMLISSLSLDFLMYIGILKTLRSPVVKASL